MRLFPLFDMETSMCLYPKEEEILRGQKYKKDPWYKEECKDEWSQWNNADYISDSRKNNSSKMEGVSYVLV